MLFTEFSLDERLQRALATAGFETPTPIQAAAMPVALAGRDLVGTAQTGTGKTAAFVLPILQQLITIPLEMRKTRAVILAPTRELVEQTLAVVRELGSHTNLRAVAVYGGVPMQNQVRALRNGVDIVVACPGRLFDHIKRRNTDFRQLDYLVLDEADRMLDMGFMPHIQEIISHLPETRQTMLFSATFPRTLNTFVEKTLRNPERVEVDTAVAAQTVRHSLYQVKGSMKMPVLTALLNKLAPESDSVLIFTRTRATANQVAEHLQTLKMPSDVLHAEKTQRARQDTLDRFRAGIFPYLVATDVAARGIDVNSITHVINYDLPAQADDYLHRIGRTGRMERTGYAISLMTRGDGRAVRDIERMLGEKITVAPLEAIGAQQMGDAITAPNDSKPRAPRPQHATASRATGRTFKPRNDRMEERPRRAPRRDDNMPMEPSQRADRPARAPRAGAPRGIAPRSAAQADMQPAGERTGKRFDKAAPARADRRQRKRYEDAPTAAPARNERHRKGFGSAASAGKPRPERRRFDGDEIPPPKRADRFDEKTRSDAPRQERPTGKQFTGMASASKYSRKFDPGKRQPGEVSFGTRSRGKSKPASTRPAKSKRSMAGRAR